MLSVLTVDKKKLLKNACFFGMRNMWRKFDCVPMCVYVCVCVCVCVNVCLENS